MIRLFSILLLLALNSGFVAAQDFPFPDKSAVDKLNLSGLRDSQNPDTQRWVSFQNQRTANYLTLDSEGKADRLFEELTKRAGEYNPNNPPQLIETSDGRVLFTRGGELILRDGHLQESIIAPKEILPQGSQVVAEFKLSPNEKLVAAAYVENGLDVNNWKIFDLESKKFLAGPFSVRLQDFNWSFDSESVYYTKWASLEEAAEGKAYAHNYNFNLKTNKHTLVFKPHAHSSEFFSMDDFQDAAGNRYLVAHRTQGAAEHPAGVYLGTKRSKNKLKWKTIYPSKISRLGKYLGHRNGSLFFRITDVGNTFGISALDLKKNKSRVIVPAQKNEVLLLATILGQKIYTQYLNTQSFQNSIKVFDLNGKCLSTFLTNQNGLTDKGTLTPFFGTQTSPAVYFTYSDVAQPPVTYRIDAKTLNFEKLPDAGLNFDSSKVDYTFKWVESEDGTKIPLKIYTRSDVKEPKFVYLYYYGYIGIPQLPQWNRKFQHMLDLGGVVAIVSPRGGGSFGRDWQMDVKDDRFPSMQDIVAGSKELKSQFPGIKVVASGRSFGGMMTDMLMVHYPEHFDAFSSVVPVTDLNEFLSRGLFGRFAFDDFKGPRGRSGKLKDSASFRDQLNTWSPLWNLHKLDNIKPVIHFSGGNDERTGPEQARFMVKALLDKFPESQDSNHLYEFPLTGHNSRPEFNYEAMFVARVLKLSVEDYKPLRK